MTVNENGVPAATECAVAVRAALNVGAPDASAFGSAVSGTFTVTTLVGV